MSDVYHVVEQSGPLFKEMLRLLKYASNSQLMSFLRKLKKQLNGCQTGHTLLLPVIVESKEMLMLLHRVSESTFKVVVVQTDPHAGLQYHDSQAAPPQIKYRTCLVLDMIPKKFALDSVFW